jgi:hypothetical protein
MRVKAPVRIGAMANDEAPEATPAEARATAEDMSVREAPTVGATLPIVPEGGNELPQVGNPTILPIVPEGWN